jgi:hypothetical protein
VIDHFHDEIQQILSELHSDHRSLFLFLKTAIEVHLSGKLDLSDLTARNYQTVERRYFSGELEDYLHRLSNLPKLFDRNPVSMTDELVELYLEVSVSTVFFSISMFDCSFLNFNHKDIPLVVAFSYQCRLLVEPVTTMGAFGSSARTVIACLGRICSWKQ